MMKMNYTETNDYHFYEKEINLALDYLYNIRDEKNKGWAWVQFIMPNEQNTAEVICAFLDSPDWLDKHPDRIHTLIESINYWLIDTSHAKISIDYCWVLKALQKIRECEMFYEKLDGDSLKEAINNCLEWICQNYSENQGWSDNDGENSSVIRTALAIDDLNREIEYCAKNGLTPSVNRLQEIRDKALKWIVKVQNPDGGWGNLDPTLIDRQYQLSHQFTFSDLKYQCDSNPASTGYVMLALSADRDAYERQLKKAFSYLKESQMDNGGWQVFTEIGVREGERYTFRHFSTAWALHGMLESAMGDYRDDCVVHGMEYLAGLQDDNYGGWKSSPDADTYTWATCNAIIVINALKSDLGRVHAKHFLGIVWEWWELKIRDANHSFSIGKVRFAFNNATALLFCITFSLLITLGLVVVFNLLEPCFIGRDDVVRKFVYSIITVLSSVLVGLPWIVFVKNKFKSEVPGWIDSIGWVYGIITGFVLVLYQFIL